MKAIQFNAWLGEISRLSRGQRARLWAELERKTRVDETVGVLETAGPEWAACPHCGDTRVGLWGRSGGLQRYRCGGCRRTYNALTGTPLARLRHKEKWLAYEQALIDGLSIRQAAVRCGVAKNTSFKWRHRFLHRPAQQKSTQMQGVAEADETFFIESFKGKRHLARKPRRRGGTGAKRSLEVRRIPVLVVRDRHGATADFQLSGVGMAQMEPVLQPLLAPDVILCTDGASAYALVARHLGLAHHAVNPGRGFRTQGPYHIQNVNAYDSRLKGWMQRFHGVATRYLENYLGWRRLLEYFGKTIQPTDCLRAALSKERPFQQPSAT